MDTRWRKGVSGNPAGRPKGSCNRSTLFRQALVASAAERIAADIVRRAREGEGAALRILAKWQRDWMHPR